MGRESGGVKNFRPPAESGESACVGGATDFGGEFDATGIGS